VLASFRTDDYPACSRRRKDLEQKQFPIRLLPIFLPDFQRNYERKSVHPASWPILRLCHSDRLSWMFGLAAFSAERRTRDRGAKKCWALVMDVATLCPRIRQADNRAILHPFRWLAHHDKWLQNFELPCSSQLTVFLLAGVGPSDRP